MFNRLKSEHQHVEEMLSAYLDRELSPKEQARVEKHLVQCAACAQNLHTLRQTVALLGELPAVAVPRAFTVRPTPAAQRLSFFRTRQAYVYLRAATALATILFAVVLAGDVFLTGLAPQLAPARAPEVVVREVPVEKVVVETMVVEKEVVVTIEVEKEVMVEKPATFEATPLPVPAEKRQEMRAPQPLATPAVQGKELVPSAAPPAIPEIKALVEASRAPDEEQIEATPSPGGARIEAEAAFTPTATVEALPSTPIPQQPTARFAVRPIRPGLALLRVVEAGLLLLVLALAIATLVVRRRQGAT